MKKFCISTLTHNDVNRDLYLELTITNFLENTIIENIDWYILINGKSDLIEEKLKILIEKYKNINFITIKSDINLGVGTGINLLNTYTENYEYVLFIEGDWLLLDEKSTNFNKNWLNECLIFLETNNDIDQIYLRKYLNDIDDRQFGYGYWIKNENILKIENDFLFLKEKDYTNNPTLRRNKSFYELNIFPLNEYFDEDNNPTEIKGLRDWGQAEINVGENGKKLKTVYLLFGVFVHIDNYIIYNKNENKGCYKFEKYNCKYGFLYPLEKFCIGCDLTKDFTNLESHNHFYEREILPNIGDNEKIKELIKNNINKPVINYDTSIESK